jgi:Glycosyltransferases involved in cell wall biogenesis
MPVYNEATAIRGVVEEWLPVLGGIRGVLLVMDDGSTDGTSEILRELQQRHADRMEVIRHANRGHGQTVLEGYRTACDRGVEFVFQIDSDGQCDPKFFPEVWRLRKDFDVIYGRRVVRQDGWKRKVATWVVRLAVFCSTGVICEDANTPYRLMRAERLPDVVKRIPPTFDLANIALAVELKRARWRHASVPIVFRPRLAGESKVPFSRFVFKAFELVGDLVRRG